ncbi:MAG: hypothetical protein M3198_03640 [Actinomycetota bacterium]|nr:hypothetical protein [Actinomycetota bacterium]
MRVHFVCTGNICRSPMAELLLRSALDERGCSDIEVSSSGTWATDGLAATRSAAETMAALGLDLTSHRARALEPAFVDEADLVVVMTSVHEREVLEVAPEAASRLVLLKELVPMRAAAGDVDGSAEARFSRLMASPRPERRRALDVDDPMGLPITAYERCAKELQAGVRALADVLCSGSGDLRMGPEGRH